MIYIYKLIVVTHHNLKFFLVTDPYMLRLSCNAMSFSGLNTYTDRVIDHTNKEPVMQLVPPTVVFRISNGVILMVGSKLLYQISL